MLKLINKYDIALIVVLIIIAGLMMVVLGREQGEVGHQVKISIDGKIYGIYDGAINQTIVMNVGNKHNVVEIKYGKVKMIEADCPDKYCMRQGTIDRGHQSIVCLPNRVIVEFNKNNSNVDTVVG